MKREHALTLADNLERFADAHCTRRHKNGYYSKQMFFPLSTQAEMKSLGIHRHDRPITAKTRVITVRLDRLKSTQRCLSRVRLRYQLRRHPLHPLDELPTLIALGGGWFVLWDGNHRAAAALMLGETKIKCQVMIRKRLTHS